MTTYEIPMIISSASVNGATNKSTDGSSFEVRLEEPITVPRDAKTCTVEVQESTIWWTIPNIEAGNNDSFSLTHLGTPHIIQLPQGLYDLPGLNAVIDRELVIDGAPSGLVTISADDSTQKVVLRLNQAGSRVDLTIANSFRDILGFDSQLIPAGGPSAGIFIQLADNVAGFNTVNYFLTHTDLINRGIRFNNKYTQVVGQVLITATAGNQIVSTPFNPPKANAHELIGSSRKNIRFWLTDDKDRRVNTNGEDWSIRLVIRYTM